MEVTDFGTNSMESSDFVDFSNLVCKSILSNETDFGILICGTGIGMSIAANKHKGIYCAKIDNLYEAAYAKKHNHANVISFSAKKSLYQMKDMIDIYLKSQMLYEEKYLNRIEKIKKIEGKTK